MTSQKSTKPVDKMTMKHHPPNPYKKSKRNERHSSQRKSPSMSTEMSNNPVKTINENPNYKLINIQAQKERTLLRQCILQLTQTGSPYKSYIKDGIHGPMIRRVHKYNQDENRSLRLIRKDILEITKIEHARLCIDQQPKIEVSPTLHQIIFEQERKQTTSTLVENIEHQPISQVARMPSPTPTTMEELFPDSPNLLANEWMNMEQKEPNHDEELGQKPAAITMQEKDTSPKPSINSTDDIDQRIADLDKRIENTQYEIEMQNNMQENIQNIVEEVANDRIQKCIREEMEKVIDEGGLPDNLNATMQHATMINEQLNDQIEKAQKVLTNINENIRTKQEQYNKLIRQEQNLADKIEKNINKTYNENQAYMVQLQETMKNQAMAKQEKHLNDRISTIAENIHNTKKRQFLTMVHEQKQQMEKTIKDTIDQKLQTFQKRMEQWTTQLQTDIDSAGGHLEQEMAYIQRETQEKWHDEWQTEKHGTMKDDIRDILPNIIREYIPNNEHRITQVEQSLRRITNKLGNTTTNNDNHELTQQIEGQVKKIDKQQQEQEQMINNNSERIQMVQDKVMEIDSTNGWKYHDEKYNKPYSTQTDEQPNTPKPANIINHTFTVQQNLPKFRKEIIPCHLPEDPRQDQLEQFYDTVANMMHIYELPILHRQDLTKQGNTCPNETYLTPEMTENVNRMLYHKLIETIPEDLTAIRDILASYSHEQDGYRSLYAIMRTKCKYLRIIQPKWGPTWHNNQTGYQYLATFKSFVDEEKRYYRYYSKYDQAAEILQQAAMHENYKLMATSYLTRLIHTDNKKDKEFPNEFMPNNLIKILETSKTEYPNNETDPIPTIHKFGKKPFQHKVQKQCTACRVWGHDIDEQVCRICAQVTFCNEYIQTNPEKAHKNATAFALAHNRTRVAKVRQALGDIYPTNQEDDEETIMSFARAVTIPDDEQSSITDETGERE